VDDRLTDDAHCCLTGSNAYPTILEDEIRAPELLGLVRKLKDDAEPFRAGAFDEEDYWSKVGVVCGHSESRLC